jgi:hypothetical protein
MQQYVHTIGHLQETYMIWKVPFFLNIFA